MDKNFDDFLKYVSSEINLESVKNCSSSEEAIIAAAGQITLSYLKAYHEWLNSSD